MHMKAGKVQIIRLYNLLHDRKEDILFQRNTELGILLTGHDEIMGACSNTRCDTKHDVHLLVITLAGIFDECKFIQTIDDDSANTIGYCLVNLRGQLVIAVEFYMFCREPCLLGCVEFSTGDNIDTSPSLLQNLIHSNRTECL